MRAAMAGGFAPPGSAPPWLKGVVGLFFNEGLFFRAVPAVSSPPRSGPLSGTRVCPKGGEGAPVDTIAPDATRPQRIWAATGGRIVVSDDLGSGWHSVGRPLPEARTRVRGIAASADATTLVVSSDRGIYRSEDGGETWAPKEDNLPTHIEAGPLARDPNDAGVIYAVFSLMPYSEVCRMANEGGNLLARTDPINLTGGLSFCVLVLIGGGLAARHLSRRRAAAHSPR